MLFDSYNIRHNKQFKAEATGEVGYKISMDNGANWGNYYTGMLSSSDSLYVINSKDNAAAMWISSPASPSNSTSDVLHIDYNGSVGNDDCTSPFMGFRPVVRLNSDVELQEQPDGTFEIQDIPATAKEVAEDPDNFYGAVVSNYEIDSSVTDDNVQWQIFHADDNNIYLIASDYIKVANTPSKTLNGIEYSADANSEYIGTFSSIRNSSLYSNGSEDVSDEMKKLNYNYYYEQGYTSTNKNMKGVAYLLDSDIWSKYAMPRVADYAIGGPTVELLLDSHNKRYHTKYAAKATSAIGYKVSKDNGKNYAINYASMISINDGLYTVPTTSKAKSMWLSSPSANDGSLVHAQYEGSIHQCYYNYVYAGFRPLVCLNSDVVLLKQEDGTYKIKNALQVGDYVNYEPDSTSATTYSKANLTESYTGSSSNTEDINQEKLDWQILKMYDDGSMDLIGTPTSQKLYFNASTGYNNGVYIMNDICKTLYSRDGIEARSVRVEDFDSNLTKAGEATKSTYINNQSANITTGSYISSVDQTNNTATYVKTHSHYPMLYKQEQNNGVGLSDSYYTKDTLITTEQVGVSCEQADALTIKYTRANISMTTENYGIAYKVLYASENFDGFWVASRYTYNSTGSAGAGYGFNYGGTRLYGETVFYSNNSYQNNPSNTLRPVVHLDANIQIEASETATNSSTPHIITQY